MKRELFHLSILVFSLNSIFQYNPKQNGGIYISLPVVLSVNVITIIVPKQHSWK
jgi:hypothetical protein